MRGMMMSVSLFDESRRHAKKSCGLPYGYPGLHKPSSGGVSERVGRDPAWYAGQRNGSLEPDLDRLHGLAVPFDEKLAETAKTGPPAQMREEPGWDGHWWLTLGSRALSLGQAIED